MRIKRLAYGQPGDNLYHNRVELSVYGLDVAKPGMMTDEVRWKVDVSFSIDQEHRSWGIKDIIVVLHGAVEVVISMTAEQDESRREDVTLRFEANRLKQDKVPSDQVTVGEIDLWVKPDLSPDYDRSSITVYGPARAET